MAPPLFRKLFAPRTPTASDGAGSGRGSRHDAPRAEMPPAPRGRPTLPLELLPNVLVHLRQTTDANGGALACPRPDFVTLNAMRLACRTFAAEVVREVPAYAVERNVAALAQQGDNAQLAKARHLVLHDRGQRALTPAFVDRLPESVRAAPQLRHLELQGLHVSGTGQIGPLLAALPGNLEGLQLPSLCAAEQRQASELLHRFTQLDVLAAQRVSFAFSMHAMPTSLRALVLTHHTYASLPPAIFSLHGLEALDLSHGDMMQLPDEVERLQNLRTLRLSDNEIQFLPQAVGRLQRLTTLVVNDNALTALRFLEGGCASLQHLDASDNEIDALVSPDKMPKDLRRLILHHNKVTDPWAALGTLAALEVVDLTHNRIKNVPAGWIASAPVRALLLEDNRFSALERGRIKHAAARRTVALQMLRI